MIKTTSIGLLILFHCFLALSYGEELEMLPQINKSNIRHGTLDVVLATSKFIVIATDSRQTSGNGSHWDDSKKLFVIGKKRALAIAGLAGARIEKLPWLSVASLIDKSIQIADSNKAVLESDDYCWNDFPPPSNLPAEFGQSWCAHPYLWWNSLIGPIQTIMNVAYTFDNGINPDYYQLVGILAGFKSNGEPKIERLVIMQQKGKSDWNRPYIGARRITERADTNKPLAWMTAGVTQLADWISEGPITTELKVFTKDYHGIAQFLKRREAKTVKEISEAEMISLAKDLVRATASITPLVGSEPIQIATIRPNEMLVLEQPSFPVPNKYLPLDGVWHLGVEFSSTYPFNSSIATVYTFCKIKENQIHIPLGNNYFYGCEFERAIFIYSGGDVYFGDNNVAKDSTLIINPDVDESLLWPILRKFTNVKRLTK